MALASPGSQSIELTNTTVEKTGQLVLNPINHPKQPSSIMKSIITRSFAILTVACAFALTNANLHAGEKALLAVPGKVLYHNNFNTAPEAKWQAIKGSWEIANGVLRAAELEADHHGAVIRLQDELPDFVIDFEFKFEGAKSTSLSINAVKDHMARILITPKAVTIRRDDNDHDGPDKVVIFGVFPVDFKSGSWHKVHLEMVGDTLLGKVDDLIAWGSDPLFKEKRTNPGLTAAGQSVDFRNFTIRSATLNPKWNTVKKTPPKPGKKVTAAATQKKAKAKIN
jgi:hypothetical protein